MAEDRIDPARKELLDTFNGALRHSCPVPGVDWAMYRLNVKKGQKHKHTFDRLLVDDTWDIMGQRWILMVACDGYGGAETARYVYKSLPGRLRPALEKAIWKHCGGLLDRVNCQETSPHIISMLKRQIVKLDESLRNDIQKACPNPKEIKDEASALKFAREHSSMVARASQGSTLAMALVAIDDSDRFMWVAGVGNSTIALSTVDDIGKRRAERLCTRHTFNDPKEYQRVLEARPLPEGVTIDEKHPLLRWNPLTRVIGHTPLKMDAAYLERLFRYVPLSSPVQLSDLVGKIRTPSYLTAEPEVHFVDLKPIWHKDPILLLFTEGIDHLVRNPPYFVPGKFRSVDALDVIPALLADTANPEAEAILGHKVDPRWSGAEKNRAYNVLGNLLGGADKGRLRWVVHSARAEGRDKFLTRDTSLIVARFSEMG